MNGKPTPAPATWPYPHRTVAELDEMRMVAAEAAIERWWRDREQVQPQTKRSDA